MIRIQYNACINVYLNLPEAEGRVIGIVVVDALMAANNMNYMKLKKLIEEQPELTTTCE